MLINGGCHCGNITFTLDWISDSQQIDVRRCTCAFCGKHGHVWSANPLAHLKLNVSDSAALSKYAFATKTAEFHVCARCGVVPVATSEIDGNIYAVVNANTFEDIDPAMLNQRSVTFDGEQTDARLARRKKNWISDVVIAVT